MGVTYKLKSEVSKFILSVRKHDPHLGCRPLAALIFDKFQVRVSKSSINLLLKQAGLGMPVGRRVTHKRRKKSEAIKKVIKSAAESIAGLSVSPQSVQEPLVELPQAVAFGILILKAADYLTGGMFHLVQAISSRLKEQPLADLFAQTEALLYEPLLEAENKEKLQAYLKLLQETPDLARDILRIIQDVFQEVKAIQFILADGTKFYLDAQLHTIWSSPQIPDEFSATIFEIKNLITAALKDSGPYVLLSAPGDEIPTKELFEFILSLDSEDNKILRLTLYNRKLESIDTIQIPKINKRFFLFGLWPWQFGQYRKISLKDEFKSLSFAPLKKDFFLAEGEIILSEPNTGQTVKLRACALKLAPEQKVSMLLVTNFSLAQMSSGELLELYLSHWPDPKAIFEDFSKKSELFTYTANNQHYFRMENFAPRQRGHIDIRELFDYYLKCLDLYSQRQFLPVGYLDKGLKVLFQEEKDYPLAIFQIPPDYPHLKDLQYTCLRLNQKAIKLFTDKRVWFSIV